MCLFPTAAAEAVVLSRMVQFVLLCCGLLLVDCGVEQRGSQNEKLFDSATNN